jgi:hypothetical protein
MATRVLLGFFFPEGPHPRVSRASRIFSAVRLGVALCVALELLELGPSHITLSKPDGYPYHLL